MNRLYQTQHKKNKVLIDILCADKENSEKNEVKNKPVDQKIIFEIEYQKIKPILDIILPYIKEYRWQYKLPKKDENILLSDKPFNIEELEKHNKYHYFRYHKNVFENYSKELIQYSDWHSELNNFLKKWSIMAKYNRMYKDYSSILEGEKPDIIRWVKITSPKIKVEIPVLTYHSKETDEL